MGQNNKKWVALCTTAVAAVYAAGYFTTESSSKAMSPNAIYANDKGTSSSQNQTNLYKDGTFTGSGSNRRGSIQVAVTIKNDQITDVEITQWGMHYSESDVIDLPEEVITKQSVDVENVTGATYSTEAFKEAIQEALYQSQKAVG